MLILQVVIYLGIDTSTPYLSLALWSPEGLDETFQESIGRDHAKRLVTELDILFQRVAISKADISKIGVGIGPGSYTGLRVGIASAKGLARALGVSLTGVDSLAAIAYGCLKMGEKGVITLDARRGNVYAGVYQRTFEGVVTLQEPKKQVLDQIYQDYPEIPLFQDQAPDACYIAQQAQKSGVVRAVYL